MFQCQNLGIMRYLILILISFMLTGCRSHRSVATDNSVRVDSIARRVEYRSSAQIDSVLFFREFSFDTLSVALTRGEETVHFRAVGGRFSNTAKASRSRVENVTKSDSVALRAEAAFKEMKKSSSPILFCTIISVSVLLLFGFTVLVYISKLRG